MWVRVLVGVVYCWFLGFGVVYCWLLVIVAAATSELLCLVGLHFGFDGLLLVIVLCLVC